MHCSIFFCVFVLLCSICAKEPRGNVSEQIVGIVSMVFGMAEPHFHALHLFFDHFQVQNFHLQTLHKPTAVGAVHLFIHFVMSMI